MLSLGPNATILLFFALTLAGSTFCAIASLNLMGCLDTCLADKQKEVLRRWLVNRQIDGFQGRPNKLQDTCYSFWVGATLQVLQA